MGTIVLAIGFTGLLLGTISLVMSLWLLIEVKSMQRSTHQFTIFDPKKQSFEAMGDLMEKSDDKKMDEIYDNIL